MDAIKEAMQKLDIKKKDIYTLKELEAIAKEANKPLRQVMKALRKGVRYGL